VWITIGEDEFFGTKSRQRAFGADQAIYHSPRPPTVHRVSQNIRPVNSRTGSIRQKDSGARQRFDSSRQPRQFARDGIGVHDTLPRRPLHLRLRIAQCRGGNRLVTTRDRGFHLLDEGTHARLPCHVARGTDFGLTDALSRGCGIGHGAGSVASARVDQSCVGSARIGRRRKAGVLPGVAAQVKHEDQARG
jgi:hypothetical protein